MAFATAAAAAALARPSSVFLVNRPSGRWVFKPLAVSSFSSPSSPSAPSRRLVLYSKPGCCLCDGLKGKLQAVFLLSGPDSLHDVDLQIRDITSNPEWERAYQYEIPVLTKLHTDGTEEILPRLSPRLGVELLQKKIAAAFRQ
ncbi:uncharacterized protein LOC129294300 [Prosopis cineraria]|uniref:uncharacterized protein LOC129294300 n=1 Tax=Prosopis cineraria TaxID=364024 RepID=UPI00240EBC94|nr:uncharacterized protein LOC129294300 [Prosopis cineraria]